MSLKQYQTRVCQEYHLRKPANHFHSGGSSYGVCKHCRDNRTSKQSMIEKRIKQGAI